MSHIKNEHFEEIHPTPEQQGEMYREEEEYVNWEKNNYIIGAPENDITVGAIRTFANPNKANINEWSNNLIEAVESGFIDPFEAHMRLKAIMKACEAALEATMPLAIEAAGKYGKGETYMGNEFKVSEGRANYKYDNSPHIVTLQNKLKAAQELAKTLAKGNMQPVADTETGELIYPAIDGGGKASISITFK